MIYFPPLNLRLFFLILFLFLVFQKQVEDLKKSNQIKKESNLNKQIYEKQEKERELERTIEDLTAENKSLTRAKDEYKSQLSSVEAASKREGEDATETLLKLGDLKQQLELKQHQLDTLKKKSKLLQDKENEKKI